MNSSGEWKLGGLEYISGIQDSSGSNVLPIKVTPALGLYDPPEKNDLAKQRHITKWYGYSLSFLLNS